MDPFKRIRNVSKEAGTAKLQTARLASLSISPSCVPSMKKIKYVSLVDGNKLPCCCAGS